MNDSSFGTSPFEGMDAETKKIFMLGSMLQTKPIDFEGAGQFMERQAKIAQQVAQSKFRDETNFGMLMTGAKAAADGLQTALAGGSKEMLAYNAQAPLREGQAYLRNSQNRQRPEIAQQQIPTYLPQRFFG
jgi:hypothetical protein